MTDFTVDFEIAALGRCGLGPLDILRMLTTEPARLFGREAQTGRVAVGQIADLVLLREDPWSNPAAFVQVAATIRAGRVSWRSLPSAEQVQ